MSHNYVNDLFGRFRKGKKTKFSDLETKAKDLMKDILNNKIEYDEFFTGFSGLINEFHALCGNVINQDTPLLAQYKNIESMNYDGWLKDKIKYCLDNL